MGNGQFVSLSHCQSQVLERAHTGPRSHQKSRALIIGLRQYNSQTDKLTVSQTTKDEQLNTVKVGPHTITTYFHSYSFVPGGAVPLPPALHTTNPGFTSHHLFGQQGCSLACTCTCTCTASIVSAAAAAAVHHPQSHHPTRSLGSTTASVLLQPVEQIKDAMVSINTICMH